jgi:hypothetical protein
VDIENVAYIHNGVLLPFIGWTWVTRAGTCMSGKEGDSPKYLSSAVKNITLR